MSTKEHGTQRVGRALLLFIAVVRITAAPVPSSSPSCRLSDRVPAFHAARQSRLDSLRQFGRLNRISFGIESSTGLEEEREISAQGTVRTVLREILGRNTHAACAGPVILVRDQSQSVPNWLNLRVPVFRVPRELLSQADSLLWMEVETARNPAVKGFLGDIMNGDVGGMVGPFDKRNATARELLCTLVAASPGSIWISGSVMAPYKGTSFINQLWTLLPYEPEPGAGSVSALVWRFHSRPDHPAWSFTNFEKHFFPTIRTS